MKNLWPFYFTMTKLFQCTRNLIKHSVSKLHSTVEKSSKPPWKVLFFGSDDFSLFSLKALFKESQNPVGVISKLDVVTCSQQNPIWKFCQQQQLLVHKWPPDLKEAQFDVGLIVSFGYLIPEHIISKFPLGMLNVHGSLLPRWRGASPIVYAIANGDSETGVTIMRIKPHKFDTGDILLQEKVSIEQSMEMPVLYEKLGQLGAECLVKTLKNVDKYIATSRPQPENGVTYAPKITPEFSQVRWHSLTATEVYNLYRGLKGITPLKTNWFSSQIKLLDVSVWLEPRQATKPGFVEYSRKNKVLIVECAGDTWISVKQVGVQGKKVMNAADFYNGFISKLDKNTDGCFS